MRGSSRLSCEGCPLLSGPHDMQSTLSVEKSSVQDAKVRVCDREREREREGQRERERERGCLQRKLRHPSLEVELTVPGDMYVFCTSTR